MGFFDWVRDLLKGEPATPPPQPKRSGIPAPPGAPPDAWHPAAPQGPQWPQRPAPNRTHHEVRREPLVIDAGPFAPLTNDELKRKLQGLRSPFGSGIFGRRDLIPPATDPRTALIDRAMATAGFITPARLTEIHAIGAEMDRVRPDYALAASGAAADVAAIATDRETLRKRKKAEAAERKRLYDEGVADRRATDIMFLGRGVSSRMHDRQVRPDQLHRNGLPILSTPFELSQAMGIEIPELRWLAFHNEAALRIHYVQFTVPKRSGGLRTISAPLPRLARAQQWIRLIILDRLAISPEAHGFAPGRSIVTNATPHCGAEVVVNMDLKDFFPSIGFPRVRALFQRTGYSPAVATILALLCTEAPRRVMRLDGQTYHVAEGPRGLPQGACTSPALSNLIAAKLDRRLAALCARTGFVYTRYADDLSFSASGPAALRIGWLMARVRHIAAAEGFTVKEAKTRILRRSNRQEVTGVVVNERPTLDRETWRRLRAILHRARTEGLEAQNRENHPHFESWLRGMIAFARMVDPAKGLKLEEQFRALSDE